MCLDIKGLGFRVVARIFYTEARQGRNSPADRCTACISMHVLRGFGGMPPEKIGFWEL